MRNRYVFALDLLLVAFAAAGAFFLRFDELFFSRPEFLPFLFVALLLKAPLFLACGLYRRYWKYASVADLFVVIVGVTAASLALTVGVAATAFASGGDGVPLAILLSDWLLTLACVAGLRLAIRVSHDRRARERRHQNRPERKVLIAGAGAAGTAVLREIVRKPALGLRVVGLLDDDPWKQGKRIHGVRVLGGMDMAVGFIKATKAKEVIIAMPTAPGTTIRRLAEACSTAGIKSRTLPALHELLDGRASIKRLRDIDIADLLRRPEVRGPLDTAHYVTNRTVLVTGGGGSIGIELCRQLMHARPSRLVLLGHGENSLFDAENELRVQSAVPLELVVADVRDRERVRRTFERFRPSIVFHAAAHKHVPLMERNPEEAITNNILGTANVVDAARAMGTQRLVLISTDKAVEPCSIMGASKRVAEQIVMQAARCSERAFSVVRFGNVLGSRGSVVPYFKHQIEIGGPITITHPDVSRFFMTIPEAVHLVLQAGGMAQGGELFVLDMGEPLKIVDLAKDLINLSGYSPAEIGIVYTGLRPGEKLEERLWDEGAEVQRTGHPDILWVVGESEDLPSVPLEQFVQAARRGNRHEIERLLAQQVPNCLLARPSGAPQAKEPALI